ncbi:MAG: hypothetical protein LBH18_05770, partial [Spirochaetaceae bacterium]|jgi:hypothetical protein|nr:hypothetical protein [Spirochaetaceae bacterium]
MTGSAHFGGVVGHIANKTASATLYTLRNISITGNLNYKLSNQYLLAGGLIGEIGLNATILIENCSSDININVVEDDRTQGGGNNTRGFGGLIGKIGGSTTTINNCRTGGEITADLSNNTADARVLVAGGIVGDITDNSKVEIKNSYSTTDINLKTAMSGLVAGGGLVGRYASTNTTNGGAKISDSAVLNETINAQSSNGSNIIAHRVVGYHSGNGQVANNYALSTMMVNGSVVSDGTADSLDGLSKTAAELKTKATWVSDLKFSEDNWDFGNITMDGYPTLRLKSSN